MAREQQSTTPSGAGARGASQLSALDTEGSNPASADLDRMSALKIAQVMNAEDARVAAAVHAELPAIARAMELIAERLGAGGRLIYAGAGTSGRLGALDALECSPTFGVSPDLIVGCIAGGTFALDQAAEDLEDSAEAGDSDLARMGILAADVVVAITASGRTPYALGAVARAGAVGAATIGLACNAETPLSQRVDVMIAPIVGPEVLAGSTRLKAGTAQKMVLNMLSTGAMALLGKVYGNQMVDVRPTNEKLHARALGILRQATGLDGGAASTLLDACDGEVRTAIVAGRLALDPDSARARLAAHGQHIRAALDAQP
jgi:N-acetylmuramic acid 6-phosphate etherase